MDICGFSLLICEALIILHVCSLLPLTDSRRYKIRLHKKIVHNKGSTRYNMWMHNKKKKIDRRGLPFPAVFFGGDVTIATHCVWLRGRWW
ncbi:hypothetical protein HanPSC8_Chr14g0597871 [Helianthus annuus]|nr:hypothetical protein HanPSC8_Chr14g0597871 [Helianthus annuus]